MSRKLRYFNEQISKACLTVSARPAVQPDIDLEQLEVFFLLAFVPNCC